MQTPYHIALNAIEHPMDAPLASSEALHHHASMCSVDKQKQMEFLLTVARMELDACLSKLCAAEHDGATTSPKYLPLQEKVKKLEKIIQETGNLLQSMKEGLQFNSVVRTSKKMKPPNASTDS